MTWLRSNRWYLVAVAVLLPLAFLVALSTDWWDYLEAESGRATAVEGNETVEYAGAQWSLLEWHSFDAQTDAGQSAALLPGTALVTATLGVRPGDPAPFCSLELTDTAGQRTWLEASFSDADFEIDDDAENYCDSAATAPYLLQVFFVVPEDATEHPRLRLTVGEAYPAFLSFEL